MLIRGSLWRFFGMEIKSYYTYCCFFAFHRVLCTPLKLSRWSSDPILLPLIWCSGNLDLPHNAHLEHTHIIFQIFTDNSPESLLAC